MSETLVLTKRWGKPDSAKIETYRADGGYKALERALRMERFIRKGKVLLD